MTVTTDGVGDGVLDRDGDWLLYVRGKGLASKRESEMQSCGPCPFYPPCDTQAVSPAPTERRMRLYLLSAFVGFILGVVLADVRKWWEGRD